jgi:phage-related protein
VGCQLCCKEWLELRRPAADFLRDGIYELRAKHVKVQYRILYFFHGQNVVVLGHAFVKEESQVPNEDIDLALMYKEMFVLIAVPTRIK